MIDSLPIEQVTDLRFLGPFHAVQAQLALSEGRHRDAAEQVRLGLEAVRGGQNALEVLRLCVIGLCRAADDKESGDGLALLANDAVKKNGRTAEIDQIVQLCAAERQRALGKATALLWAGVAEGWANLDRRFPAAYARWREAEAAVAEQGLARAREAARAAYATAEALRAEPLRRQVEALARKARIDLPVRRPPAQRPYDLTQTESETLGLRYEGLTNADIAKLRSCSVRTVETHLKRIYNKLGVRSLADAITKARRENMFGG
jgi:DNA-binding NarL/FixJ family response regulator